MRSIQKAAFVTVAATSILGSCMSRDKTGGGSGNANMKTVTINQPDLKKEMLSSLSEDDKKKVMESLVYSIAINPALKDNKDDCNDGVTASKFDSGVLTMDKSTFDSIKIKRGCNYIVSMKVGAKSDDGKAIKSLYISSWDDKQPSLLSKEELEKAKPTAVVKLFVTSEGKKYWDADEIVTPGEADTTIDPSLSKSFALKAENLVIARDTNAGVMTGTLSLTPFAADKADQYCAVFVVSKSDSQGQPTAAIKENSSQNLFVDGDAEKSIVKFAAGSVEKKSIKVSEQVVGPTAAPVSNKSIESVAHAYCSTDEGKAKSFLEACAGIDLIDTGRPQPTTVAALNCPSSSLKK